MAKTVQICLGLASFSMMARMLLPIFVNPMDSRLYAVACYVSEPFVLPEQAYCVTRILEGIYTSAKTGKPYYFED